MLLELLALGRLARPELQELENRERLAQLEFLA